MLLAIAGGITGTRELAAKTRVTIVCIRTWENKSAYAASKLVDKRCFGLPLIQRLCLTVRDLKANYPLSATV